jgi:hypothetical protein
MGLSYPCPLYVDIGTGLPIEMIAIVRKRYPANWKEISLQVRSQADWTCERCGAKQGEPHPITKSKVVLTVAHLGPNKHDKMDCSHGAALCQRCHLREDSEEHIANAKQTRGRKKREAMLSRGQLELIPNEELVEE